MSISLRKLGILTAITMVFLLFAVVRPGTDTPTAEADFATPGGIWALPSAAPGMPWVTNQQIPAIIGTGQYSIVGVQCESATGFDCTNPLTFTLTRLYPDGAPAASFAATGTDTVVVTDELGADMDWGVVNNPGVVAVRVNAAAATTGGTQGVNEILQVAACDDDGVCRTVVIVVVDTILAWGPTGQVSTAAQEQPVFISYHCDVLGRSPISDVVPAAAEAAVGDADGQQGLDDMYDGLYLDHPGVPTFNAFGDGYAGDLPDVWCGGNTAGLFDDFVDFQTDLGSFTVDPAGLALGNASVTAGAVGIFYPPMLDFDCGEGKNIDTEDIDGLSAWGAFLFGGGGFPPGGAIESGCDLDGWRNGVVTTELVGTGQAGVATITAQQGGGISPPRTINVTFTGEAALSLFIDAPASIGISGDDFMVILTDQDGRPVGDESVECTVEPAGGALVILPQTGTTDSQTGEVEFSLVPTGASVIGAEELTLTCVLDSDRSIKASETLNLSMTPDLESVDLVVGCNPVASTWPDGTAATAVGDNVAPAEALDAIWKFDPGSGAWQGYSPAAPQASDLASVDMLDAIFICTNAAATWARPVI